MLTATPEIEALQARAKAGDITAAAQFKVKKWNTMNPRGTRVTYEKSQLEGRIILKTVGAAFVLGDEPVVELEHIGAVMLKKIELAETFEHSKSKHESEVLAPARRSDRQQLAVALGAVAVLVVGYVTQHVLHWW